jgi:hypothetical protein
LSNPAPSKLAWPPKKDDLERLYLVEGLSAMKIANIYGLRYKNPKVAESTVLYQLKRNGIKRRGASDHVRKVSEEMVDDWVRRYQEGESLKEIAGGVVSPAAVFLHLHKRGLELREKVGAQIQAVTKHARRPFSGSKEEEAYLIGFARGDLNVSRHGRAVRVKTSSTHPLMFEHLKHLFVPYGHVLVFPRKSELAGFEWSFQADLDQSFQFLVESLPGLPKWIFETRCFFSFLAGFFDAEGSIWLRNSGMGFEISLTNSDLGLLETIRAKLRLLGFELHLSRDKNSSVWRLKLWNQVKVIELIHRMPIRHPEKVAKVRIAQDWSKAASTEDYDKVFRTWDELLAEIKSGRDEFVRQAEESLEKAGR